MSPLFQDGPIVACSSGTAERTAISVLRVSGFLDWEQVKVIFDWKKKGPPRARFAELVSIRSKNKVLDTALVIFFPSPNSFTGENVLEIHLHGNPINVRRVQDLLYSDLGFRAALPGEFTFRALKNKKMTLSQVEGLDLFLNSSSHFSLDQAQEIMGGDIHREYNKLHKSYLRLKVQLELFFDFLEDVGVEQADKGFNDAFEDFYYVISSFAKRIQNNSFDLNRPVIALFGPVNAGKSSLFNNLLSENRAIVSAEAGTTRDFISESIYYNGVNFRLVDTAGLREGISNVEKLGIAKGIEQIERSFFKILVLDGSMPESYSVGKFDFDLKVLTHRDKVPQGLNVGNLNNNTPLIQIDNYSKDAPIVAQKILEHAYKKFSNSTENRPILIDRHRELLIEITNRASDFRLLLEREKDVAILASELYLIGQKVEQLIGVVTPTAVLDSLFGNFCIGK